MFCPPNPLKKSLTINNWSTSGKQLATRSLETPATKKSSFSFHTSKSFLSPCVLKEILPQGNKQQARTERRILIRNCAWWAALNIHTAWKAVQDIKGILSAANYCLIPALGNFHLIHHRADNLLPAEVRALPLLPTQSNEKRGLPTTKHINSAVTGHDFLPECLVFNGKYPAPAGTNPRGTELRLLSCDWCFNWLFRGQCFVFYSWSGVEDKCLKPALWWGQDKNLYKYPS